MVTDHSAPELWDKKQPQFLWAAATHGKNSFEELHKTKQMFTLQRFPDYNCL